MKCPLYISFATLVGRGLAMTSTDCLQEECAVWDERGGCCGERTKRVQLERIADALKHIASKIPLGGKK